MWVFLNLAFFKNFFLIFLVVVWIRLSPFSYHHFPLPLYPHIPPSILPLFGFIHGSFIHVPWWLFPFFPLLSPSPPPLVTVSLFFISMSLVIFCLLVCFVDQVLLIDEIIWYLSFIAWLPSVSIMLSSSTHAAPKGRSSFFLSSVKYSIVNVPLFLIH